MRNETLAEERTLSTTRAIDVLIDKHESAGRQFLFERPDGAERQDAVHPSTLQDVNVGAVVQLRWRDPMPTPMPRKESDAIIFKSADQDVVRRSAKG